jgi:hypothetical protein
MPKATIIFQVPQDFAALQGAIADFPGECDRIDYDNLDNLDEQLQGLIGETIQIDFDEPHDPSEPIDLIVKALKTTEGSYLASHESYTDPARGDRYQARILTRVAGSRMDKHFPWAEGEPEISDRNTFLKAGFTEEQTRAIDAAFFPASTPKP